MSLDLIKSPLNHVVIVRSREKAARFWEMQNAHSLHIHADSRQDGSLVLAGDEYTSQINEQYLAELETMQTILVSLSTTDTLIPPRSPVVVKVGEIQFHLFLLYFKQFIFSFTDFGFIDLIENKK